MHLYLPLRFPNPLGIASRLECIRETMAFIEWVGEEEEASHATPSRRLLDGTTKEIGVCFIIRYLTSVSCD